MIATNAFLTKLNQFTAQEKLPEFNYHEPKKIAFIAYGFVYIPSEGKAREIAKWLLQKRVDSEVLYVEQRKHYMVKIPFVNTYLADHFEKRPRPVEFEEIEKILSITVESVDALDKEVCSEVSRALGKVIDCYEESKRARMEDLVQTHLFYGQNIADDPLLPRLGSVLCEKLEIKEVEGGVRNWCDFIKQIDSEFKAILALTEEQKVKAKWSQQAAVKAIQSICARRKAYISKFCELTLSDIVTKGESLQLENFLYRQWLFLNKQIELIQNDPQYADLLKRCREIKARTIDATKIAERKKIQTPLSFFRDETEQYFVKFLHYESGVLTAEEKRLLHNQRELAAKIVKDNSRDISAIRAKYEALKKETYAVAMDIFVAMNPGKKPQDASATQ